MRAIARQTAAREAAEAESALTQLRSLVSRTGSLADNFADLAKLDDGHRLGAALGFRAGLITIRAQALTDQTRAQLAADAMQRALAEADQRQTLVQDRAAELARTLARPGDFAPSSASRRTGTELEV